MSNHGLKVMTKTSAINSHVACRIQASTYRVLKASKYRSDFLTDEFISMRCFNLLPVSISILGFQWQSKRCAIIQI